MWELKLLGITIDDNSFFNMQFSNLSNIAVKCVWAQLPWKHLPTKQAKHLSEAYIMSTFKTLIWMFCSKSNLVNNIHKCILQLLYL